MSTISITKLVLNEKFNEIAKEALEPMSIVEIQDHFKLSFPFKVKRVKDSLNLPNNPFKVGVVYSVSDIVEDVQPNGEKGIRTNNRIHVRDELYRSQCAILKDYQLAE